MHAKSGSLKLISSSVLCMVGSSPDPESLFPCNILVRFVLASGDWGTANLQLLLLLPNAPWACHCFLEKAGVGGTFAVEAPWLPVSSRKLLLEDVDPRLPKLELKLWFKYSWACFVLGTRERPRGGRWRDMFSPANDPDSRDEEEEDEEYV